MPHPPHQASSSSSLHGSPRFPSCCIRYARPCKLGLSTHQWGLDSPQEEYGRRGLCRTFIDQAGVGDVCGALAGRAGAAAPLAERRHAGPPARQGAGCVRGAALAGASFTLPSASTEGRPPKHTHPVFSAASFQLGCVCARLAFDVAITGLTGWNINDAYVPVYMIYAHHLPGTSVGVPKLESCVWMYICMCMRAHLPGLPVGMAQEVDIVSMYDIWRA